jgi:1-acyl-sn-glycerol-3-phosphate acyltransferase
MPEQPVFVRGHLSPKGVERLRRTFAWLYGLFADVEVRGLENVPSGGALLATNHLSRFDPPLIFFTVPNRKVTVFNALNYRSNPIFRWVLESVDVVWVDRGATSPATIKAAVTALREGSLLGIAPEGTRSKTGALQEGKTGAAFLAMASGAPVVPVALTNTQKLGRAVRSLRRITLTVAYGVPFHVGEPGRRSRSDPQRLETATAEIMCRIAALLPREYRGLYANHPRLQELLAGDSVASGSAAG